MSVVGIYCEECGMLIGACDEQTQEREYAPAWCGKDEVERCVNCDDPFNLPLEEDDVVFG